MHEVGMFRKTIIKCDLFSYLRLMYTAELKRLQSKVKS